MKKENSALSVLTKGIIAENPVFVLVLGTCPTLATTTSVIGAFAMGIAAIVVLLCSNVAVSLLRKIIPETVRIPSYIVIIAGFVTMVEMLMHAYFPDLYELLGVYLALLTVNCIILGRAELFARNNSVGKSALDGIGMGVGFTLALLAMATVREILGAGTFAGIEIPFMVDHTIGIFVKAPGGMMVFGIFMALVAYITKGKVSHKRGIGCSSCPSAGVCDRMLSQCDSDCKEEAK